MMGTRPYFWIFLLALSPMVGCDDTVGDDDATADETPTPAGDDDTVSGDDDTAQQTEPPGDDDTSEPATPPPDEYLFTMPDYELSAPVEILQDSAGIPHIYGATDEDVLWGQGYVTARDRMWQMDYNRRAARGELSEILGEDYYATDVYVRALNLSAESQRSYEALQQDDPEVAGLLNAYAAGVNAFLTAAIDGLDGASLPPQVEALGYVPGFWQATDSLAIDKLLTFELSTNLEVDLAVGLIGDLLEPEVVHDLFRVQPVEPAVIVPDFYAESSDDSSSVGSRSASAARASRARLALGLTPEQVKGALRAVEELKLDFSGSNSWVVSGDYTESGYPILADDTHEGVEAPSTYLQMHLNSQDGGGTLDVIGYNFAGAPLVAFGNNPWAAWGVTTNFADVTDLYIEDTLANYVYFEGEWIEMESRTTYIKVRDEGGSVEDAPWKSLTLKTVPHHGPVLPREAIDNLPLTISVRWAGYGTDSSMRFLYDLNRSHSFESFEEALTHFRVGGINFIFANVEGDIGYSARVDIPIREQISPDYPPYALIPGGGGYEWTGELVPDDQIPHVHNPEKGFVVTANNDPSGNVQDNDIYNDPYYLGATYTMGSRAQRITDRLEELAATGNITLDDMAELQADNYSLFATHLVPFVLEAAANRPDLVSGSLADAISLLGGWDYHTDDDSGASLVYHTWLAYLFRAILADESLDEIFDDMSPDYINILCRPTIYFLEQTADNIEEIEAGQADFPSESGLNYFDNQDTETLETRDEVLLSSLGEAVEHLVGVWGDDVSSWTWADAHTITFSDPVGDLLPEASSGPHSLDGGFFTVDVAEYRVTWGGEVQDVLDVRNAPSQRTLYSLVPGAVEVWDVLPGGQSERPDDPHFNDQLDDYLGNQYRVRPFYRSDVEEEATEIFTLGIDGRKIAE